MSVSPSTPGTRPRALYEHVAAQIEQAIESGEFLAGGSLPTEGELQERYGVSRDTVRRALHSLTAQGLLSPAGKGRTHTVRRNTALEWSLSSFEARALRPEESAAGDAWSAEVRRQGRTPSETVEVSIVPASASVAASLQLQEGAFVVVRRRVRSVDGAPYQLADSYFPEELVRGTPLATPGSVHAPGGVLASLGLHQVKFSDRIAVRMPTRSETARLDLPAGTPVAEVTRIGYDANGCPLRAMISIAPGDRNVITYEHAAPGAPNAAAG